MQQNASNPTAACTADIIVLIQKPEPGEHTTLTSEIGGGRKIGPPLGAADEDNGRVRLAVWDRPMAKV